MQRWGQALIAGRMQGALLTFETMHNRLLQARAYAKALSVSDAEAFWAGPGHGIKQEVDAAAWWAATAYKAYVAAGLAGCVRSSDRALIIAANRHLDQEALPP